MISIATHIAIETEGELTPAQAHQDGKRFEELSTEELLAMAKKTGSGAWNKWTREMLIAFFHNRFGKFVPQGN